MALRLAVFDVAGTTVTDDGDAVGVLLTEALNAGGVRVDHAAVDPFMGTPKPAAIRTLAAGAWGREPELGEMSAILDDFHARMIRYYETADVAPTEGAEELFETLRAGGVRVGLDTGFDRVVLDAVLRRMNWTDRGIDDSVATDEVPRGRPHPDMIHALMRRAGVDDPTQVVKVGDSVSDVEQGLAAGCGTVVAVLSGRTRPVIQRYPGVIAVESLADLAPELESRGVLAAGGVRR